MKTEQVLAVNGDMRGERQLLTTDCAAVARQNQLIGEQIQDLESEVDQFMQSDQEIRNKLRDSQRSPLRTYDLYSSAIQDS